MRCVYIMRNKHLCKIGISSDTKRRLKTIQRTYSKDVYLYAKIRTIGAQRIETYLHRKYKTKNKKQWGSGGTEWFHLGFFDRLYILALFNIIKIAYTLLFIFVTFSILSICTLLF